MHYTVRVFVATTSVLLATSSFSAEIEGKLIRLAHNYPTLGTVYGDYQDAIVGPAVEGDSFIIYYTADVSESAVRVQFRQPGTFDAFGFNGLQIQDFTNAIRPFSSATLISTNFSSFDSGRISYNADNIFIDFAGLNPAGFEYVDVSISVVPEPTTALFALSGLLFVGVAIRAKKK